MKKIVSAFLIFLLMFAPCSQHRAQAQIGTAIAVGGEILGSIVQGLRDLGVDAELLVQIGAIYTEIQSGKEALNDFKDKYGTYIEGARNAYSLAQSVIYVTEITRSLESFRQSVNSYYEYAKTLPDQNFYQVTATVAQGERIVISLLNEVAAVKDIINKQMGTADAVATTGILKDLYQRIESVRYNWNKLAISQVPALNDPVGDKQAQAIANILSPGGFLSPCCDAKTEILSKKPADLTADALRLNRKSTAGGSLTYIDGNEFNAENGQRATSEFSKSMKLGGYTSVAMVIIGLIGAAYVVTHLIKYLNGTGSAMSIIRVLIGLMISSVSMWLLSSIGGV